jgi:hypothetical protein
MRQRLPDLDVTEPATIVGGIAAGRAGLGVALLCAPGWAWRLLTGSRRHGEATTLAVRMLAVRELALGLGGVMAARRDPGAVRGWGEAGVLADAGDAVTLATSPAVAGWRRPAAAAAAAGTAVGAGLAARKVSRAA